TTLTVEPLAARLIAIIITPVASIIPAGDEQRFMATGTFTDGTTADLTATVTWASSDTAVATIEGTGLATAIARGTTTITATSSNGAVTGIAALIVTQSP
ncbi:MAG: Ig-like domain-containing protein, partial [Egibacteraceae bacterium]